MTDLQLVDMTRLRAELDVAAKDVRRRRPVPAHRHRRRAPTRGVRRRGRRLPGIDDEFWKGYLHVNETKYCNVYPDTWADSLQAVAREF